MICGSDVTATISTGKAAIAHVDCTGGSRDSTDFTYKFILRGYQGGWKAESFSERAPTLSSLPSQHGGLSLLFRVQPQAGLVICSDTQHSAQWVPGGQQGLGSGRPGSRDP